MSIAVAIIEDDPVVMRYLSGLIAGSTLCRLVGLASNKGEAESLVASNMADIYLVDLGLPDINGIEIIKSISKQCPDAKVMVLTALGDMRHVMQSIQAGASGYLLKDDQPEELISKLVSLHNGNSPLSARVAKILIEKIVVADKAEESTSNAQAIERFALTDRELQVLKKLSSPDSAKVIANDLNISYFTVTQHIRNIYRKLDTSSRSGALSKARAHGIL